MPRNGESRRDRSREYEPIIDALYDACDRYQHLFNSPGQAESRRRLVKTIFQLWIHRIEDGDQLPIPDFALDDSDVVLDDQVIRWVGQLKTEIEARRNTRYG